MEERSRNYFSWDNLNEIAGIDGHLDFASRLIGKYPWNGSVKRDLETALARIRAKQQDKQLNISVIGEFSTGKSTFINAMLRTELLTSAALQGTTLASTVIEYAPNYCLSARRQNGRIDRRSFGGITEFRSQLGALTTDPDVARQYESIVAGLPSAPLAGGYRIIDTPGTNAIESWHEDVTVRALRELSDLSVILVNAVQPMPESLCQFIGANLSDVLDQCVFVVTKLDLIAPQEREMMMQYIRTKLEQRLGLTDATVLPYVSPAVLADCAAPAGRGERTELLAASYASESQLFLYAAKKRAIAQAKKLIYLIDSIYADISSQMALMSEGYRNELAELLRTRQADLKAFIYTQTNDRQESFSAAAKDIRMDAANYYRDLGDAAKSKIMSDLDSKASVDSLTAYVKDDLTPACTELAQTLGTQFGNKAGGLLTLFQEELRRFQRQFEKDFHDLAVLDVNMKHTGFGDVPAPEVNISGFKMATQYVQTEKKKDDNVFLFWAIVGIIVGTIIFPGVGSVIGFFVGGFIAERFRPQVDTVKGQSKTQLELPIREYFNEVADKMIRSFDDYQERLRQSLAGEIQRYSQQYDRIVQQRIDAETAQRGQLEGRLKSIRIDMEELKKRKAQLSLVEHHMNSFGGMNL